MVRAVYSIGSLPEYLLSQRSQMLRLLFWSIVISIPAGFTGRVVANAIDAATGLGLLGALQHLIILLSLAAAATVAMLQMSRVSASVVACVQHALSKDSICARLEQAVMSNDVGLQGADLTHLVPEIVDNIALLLRMLPIALVAVGSVIGLSSLSFTLVWVAIPWLVLGFFVQWKLLIRHAALTEEHLDAEERLHSETVAALSSVRDLYIFGAFKFIHNRLFSRLTVAVETSINLSRNSSTGRAIVNALAISAPALSGLALIPSLVDYGILSPGEVVGALTYLLAGLGAASSFLGSLIWLLVTMRVNHSRLRSLGAVPPAKKVVEKIVSLANTRLDTNNFRLEGICFSYGTGVPIVEGLELSIPASQHLAIVGPSGVGKSTLAALLSGVVTPQKGRIVIGDRSISEICDPHLMITYIPQDAYVFSGSVRDNLTYLRHDATNEDLDRASQAIGLERVIARLGDYNSEINLTTSGLSQGERQLITLARAFLAQTPIVVLDEATCYLDPAAESRVENAFKLTGCTLIVVAHRMSAALRADRILVMDGQQIHVGKHEDLLERVSLYRDYHGIWQA